MVKVLLILGLGISMVQDIKWKKIWLPLLWGITVLLLLENYLENKKDVSYLLCSVSFILFFLLAHKITKRQIGVGDAFLFGMTGAGIGWKNNFILIYVTFFLTFLASVFFVLFRKKDRNYEIPLSPFALLAYVLVC